MKNAQEESNRRYFALFISGNLLLPKFFLLIEGLNSAENCIGYGFLDQLNIN